MSKFVKIEPKTMKSLQIQDVFDVYFLFLFLEEITKCRSALIILLRAEVLVLSSPMC